MLKNIQNLGASLTKKEQQNITGGFVAGMPCRTNRDCWEAHPFLGPGDVSCRFNSFMGGRRVCVFN